MSSQLVRVILIVSLVFVFVCCLAWVHVAEFPTALRIIRQELVPYRKAGYDAGKTIDVGIEGNGLSFLQNAAHAFRHAEFKEDDSITHAYAILQRANREIHAIFKSLQDNSEAQIEEMYDAELKPALDHIVNNTIHKANEDYKRARAQLDTTEGVIRNQDADNQAERLRLANQMHQAQEQAAFDVALAKKTVWKWEQKAHDTFTKEAAKIPGQKYFEGT